MAFTKKEKARLKVAMEYIASDMVRYSCVAIGSDQSGAFGMGDFSLRFQYADFYAKPSSAEWFSPKEHRLVKTKNHRLTLLALFLVTKGKL